MPAAKSAVLYIVAESTGCWLWQRHLAENGYGRKGVPGEWPKTIPAHRFYYEEEHGPVPDGHELHHECRNRACVNPAHLRPITHLDHMRQDKSPLTWADVRAIRASDEPSKVLAERYDMTHGGIRTVRLNVSWHDPDYVPRKQKRKCLTEADARMILRSDMSGRALARLLGVDHSTVGDVRHGRTFPHLPR